MKKYWAKYNIYLLTIAAIIVLIYLFLNWQQIDTIKKWLGLFFVGITLHEWEETRFPGGFFELMTRKFGISDVTEYKRGLAHGSVVLAISFFSLIPFILSDIEWLSVVPAILGIFEAIIHIAGIRIHHLTKPYSPGMATALLCLLPCSIGIIITVGSGTGWKLLLSFIYYFLTFACMEIMVWSAFGVSPKDLPQTFLKAILKGRNK